MKKTILSALLSSFLLLGWISAPNFGLQHSNEESELMLANNEEPDPSKYENNITL